MIWMIKVHCLTPWLRCDDGVPSQSHVDTLTSTAITSLGVEHNLGQQGGALTGLAVVSVHIAIIQTNWTSGNLTGARVILAASRRVGRISLILILPSVPGLQTFQRPLDSQYLHSIVCPSSSVAQTPVSPSLQSASV